MNILLVNPLRYITITPLMTGVPRYHCYHMQLNRSKLPSLRRDETIKARRLIIRRRINGLLN